MPVADDAFVSLADILRPPREMPEPIAQAPEHGGIVSLAHSHSPAHDASDADNIADLARDVRLFRAQLRDAFDASLDTLLRECAYAILGRELQLADCDVAAIIERVIASHAATQPLRVRVAPVDLARCVAAPALPPCVADALLAPGDAIVEIAAGAIDARLGIRLAALFERAC